MTTTQTKRICETCPTILSIYNPGTLCGVCQAADIERQVQGLLDDLDERNVTPGHDRESLVEQIQAWHAEHGHAPGYRDCGGDGDLPARSVFQYHFGTWAHALKAAGLPVHRPGRPRKSENRTKVLEAMRAGLDDSFSIGERTGLSGDQVRRVLTQMRNEGVVGSYKVPRVGDGIFVRWYLVKGDE